MADFGPRRLTPAAVTITLASLAADSALLAGQQSSLIDLTANMSGASVPPYDCVVGGQLTTGTSPTAGVIEVWAFAPIGYVSSAFTWPDVITAAGDAAKTFNSTTLKSLGRNIATIATDSTSNRKYSIPPTSLRTLFGYLPPQVVLFVTQSTGVALNATAGNQYIQYAPETIQSA